MGVIGIIYNTYFLLPHLGVIPRKNSKFIPGIGRESTERYSSSKRLFTAPLSERSAHASEKRFSRVMLLIKYGGR